MTDQPDFIAAIDQARAAVPEYVSLLWGFHRECLESGFDGPEALTLTSEFLRVLLGSGTGGES